MKDFLTDEEVAALSTEAAPDFISDGEFQQTWDPDRFLNDKRLPLAAEPQRSKMLLKRRFHKGETRLRPSLKRSGEALHRAGLWGMLTSLPAR
jgi:hypothetical protein